MIRQSVHPTSKKKTVPVREKVYRRIKSAILSGRFSPGKRLKEEYMAEQLGVSRTPVREALHRLEFEGLIKSLETRGFMVSHDSMEGMEELFEIRTFLEGYALRSVCQSISEEIYERLENLIKKAEMAWKRGQGDAVFEWNRQFHESLHDLVREKSRVRWLMVTMKKYAFKYRKKPLKYPDGGKKDIDGHKKILLALRLKDPDLCEKVMRDHMLQAKEDAVQATLETTLMAIGAE